MVTLQDGIIRAEIVVRSKNHVDFMLLASPGPSFFAPKILQCTIQGFRKMNEDEQARRMNSALADCNLTIPTLPHKVRNGRKNLSRNIVLAHLNQKHFQASKLESAEVQVVFGSDRENLEWPNATMS
jgi:hypothetical protein